MPYIFSTMHDNNGGGADVMSTVNDKHGKHYGLFCAVDVAFRLWLHNVAYCSV